MMEISPENSVCVRLQDKQQQVSPENSPIILPVIGSFYDVSVFAVL